MPARARVDDPPADRHFWRVGMNRWVGLSAALAVSILLASTSPPQAQSRTYSFGVIIWRSPMLTAQFWNPILRYVSERSGVPLQLKVASTGPEHTIMVGHGAL